MSNNNGEKNIWKSIKDYQDDPEVLKAKLDEFKEGVTDDFSPSEMSKFSRRKFLALLAASTAYATTACTNYRDKGEIIPYVNRPEEILPGKPTFYASTFSEDGIAYGVLVKTREGRPIKIDGNPDDPVNKGKIPSKVHSSILNLYDPERLQFPTKDNRKVEWSKVTSEIVNQLEKYSLSGKEISLVTSAITSPSTIKIIEEFKSKYKTTEVYTVQLGKNSNKLNAWEKSFGSDEIPSVKWNEAEVIISLESDFLGREGNTVESRRLYAESRNVKDSKSLSKLFVVEGGMSLTGMNSDVRLRLNPILQSEFVLSLMSELSSKGAISSTDLNLGSHSLSKFAEKYGLNIDKLNELVSDVVAKKGKTFISAGETLSEETHLLVNQLNYLLNSNNIYCIKTADIVLSKISSSDEIKKLVSKMKKGDVGCVIHLDSNPVYELSNSSGYTDALENIETVITLSETPTETSAVSSYVLPLNNYLESWGDHKVRTNYVSVQQPVINPLFDTLQKEDILLNLINGKVLEAGAYHKYLMENVKNSVYSSLNSAASFDTFWYSALHDGIIPTSDETSSVTSISSGLLSSISLTVPKGITVTLKNNYHLGNGKHSNNGWLQELPHPVTKVTWDNYAAIAPATAESFGIQNNDVVKIKVSNGELNIPAMIQPGMSENTVEIELGYGRENSGEVANGVGFNANVILTSDNFIFDGAEISKTGEVYELVSTQEHHSLNEEFVKDLHRSRNIIQEGTLDEYQKNPEFLKEHKHEIFSITEPHEYPNEKWAMSIDLNKCLGCSECVSSCNVENNIPVVGKDQVAMGREMHWMRIDRYYSGTPEEPIVSTQPMLCQHCDNAPCENVCPVNATNHSPDGLNQMAYNRCVGTRYCANNCPYKVRRFNFYNFRDHFEDAYYQNELSYLALNPEVTVRSRGVIEKCSFCVQNIMEAREVAIREGRELGPEDVKTSCQVACPTNAIEFGNANDETSKVAQHREHELSYHVLEELNVKPNVTYLAKIRNTRSEDV